MSIFEKIFGTKRARDLAGIEREISDYFWKNDVVLNGIYAENGQLFAVGQVIGADGMIQPELWRTDIALVDDALRYGEAYQVKQSFEPTLTVARNADGKMQYFGVVGSAFVNRDGEIDSTQLFERFVQAQADGAERPYLDIYHLGEQSRIGQATANFVIGALYYEVGEFDDTPAAQAWAQAIAENPEHFGFSIAYRYSGEPRIERINGMDVPVYDDGIHVATSLLLASHAAAYFTGAKTRGIMNDILLQRIEQALALLPADLREAERTRLTALLNSTQRAGLAFRAVSDTPTSPALTTVAQAGGNEELPTLAQVRELAVQVQGLREQLRELDAKLDSTGDEIGNVKERMNVADGEIGKLSEQLSAVVASGDTRRSLRNDDGGGQTAAQFAKNL